MSRDHYKGVPRSPEFTSTRRMLTSSANLPIAAQVAWERGEMYTCDTGPIVIPSPVDVTPQWAGTAMEGYTAQWFKNTHTEKSLVIHAVTLFADGGDDLNYDIGWSGKFAYGDPTVIPTGNYKTHDTARITNGNFGLAATGVESYAWDGVGNGLTLASGSFDQSVVLTQNYTAPGTTEFPLYSTFVIPPAPNNAAFVHVVDGSKIPTGVTVTMACIFWTYHLDLREPTRSYP